MLIKEITTYYQTNKKDKDYPTNNGYSPSFFSFSFFSFSFFLFAFIKQSADKFSNSNRSGNCTQCYGHNKLFF